MSDDKYVYAAIDFGTAYSGYAFAFRNDLDNNRHTVYGRNWVQGNQSSKLSKTASVILFDKNKRFDSFGYEAEERYAHLAKSNQHLGWRYFKHFKMALFQQKSLSFKMKIHDDQGGKMPAITVFSEAIKYLKDDLVRTVRERRTDFQERNIIWVITVPTIWKYGAKQFMKEAVIRAGISVNQFTFALEPEAGALYYQHMSQTIRREHLCEGSHVMVVDLGGGTADITVCKVEQEGTFSEIYPPSGGPWGGAEVDKNIYDLLEKYFGTNIMDTLDQFHKIDYLQVRNGIERKKREFLVNKDQFENSVSSEVRFYIPYQLVGMHRASMPDNEHVQGFGESVILDEKRNLVRISNARFEEMFREPKEQLIGHLQDLFIKQELARVETILMIGGFSESVVMQRALEESFPGKRIVVPEDAELAVMKGAVICAYKTNLIRSRKLPYTYGISVAVPFDDSKHPKQKFFFPPVAPYPKCEDVFSPIIRKGTVITPGETTVTHQHRRPDTTATSITVEIYQTFLDNLTDPCFIDDPEMEKAGTVELQLEPLIRDEDGRLVDITMHFGAIEVSVEAHVRGSNEVVSAQFNCLYH